MGVEVTRSGPLFDGRARTAAEAYTRDAEKTIAKEGEGILVSNLARVLKHPTGYYVSQVQTVKRGSIHEVTDSGVVYGPWLEGTGEKNRTTRFKGYRHWRTTAQTLARKAPVTAQRVLTKYLRRMS